MLQENVECLIIDESLFLNFFLSLSLRAEQSLYKPYFLPLVGRRKS